MVEAELKKKRPSNAIPRRSTYNNTLALSVLQFVSDSLQLFKMEDVLILFKRKPKIMRKKTEVTMEVVLVFRFWKKLDPLNVPVSWKQSHYLKLFHERLPVKNTYCQHTRHISFCQCCMCKDTFVSV